MACLGVHFALTNEEAAYLRSLPDDQVRLRHLQETIEEEYLNNHQSYAAQSDKSWDAMHRTLSDGRLTWDGGEYPLNHVVLAGELIYAKPNYIMSLKSPPQVRDVAAIVPHLSEHDFASRYFAIDTEDYGFPLSDDDLNYTWENFKEVRELFVRAAENGRHILFTADQ